MSNSISSVNPLWVAQSETNNSLLLFQKRFEAELDVDGSRLFANFKIKENHKWIRRNLFPTVLCQQVARAERDYKHLATLFNLN